MLADTDRSWRHMVESGTTITWEAWDRSTSRTRTGITPGGAAPANLLPRYVLGAEPTAPGWQTALIRPCPGPLQHAKGKVPTPRGPIKIDWNNESGFQLRVQLPKGMAARVDVPQTEGSIGVFVDGHQVDATRSGHRWVLTQIPNGEYGRMTNAQKAAWDASYEPENQEFIRRMKAGELSDTDVVRWKYQRYIKDYLRCIQAVDDGVGRMLDYLDESGLAEDTIVIYSSDQLYLGEHGWYDKRWMFEESLKMPFLIRWPGVIDEGVRSDALIQNIDYGPTFLDVAGAEVPSEMQGRSMVPMLKNRGQAFRILA